ncbi:hypothetical protein HYH03_003506 [Edaphochlamys debaryana]|uniref:Uncharacterized protein n=1 Tax=Edaphochlamys debaryana TaxID=47281 RepID=A0A835Y9G7_9CHLO|nr:hypothetical protein HYH03_003506 [Edaphochlamys debaryana]|eukprot:KAG2498767.1 hypothetical protein HYH03_003506 [Edaphochlamys debaryana]
MALHRATVPLGSATAGDVHGRRRVNSNWICRNAGGNVKVEDGVAVFEGDSAASVQRGAELLRDQLEAAKRLAYYDETSAAGTRRREQQYVLAPASAGGAAGGSAGAALPKTRLGAFFTAGDAALEPTGPLAAELSAAARTAAAHTPRFSALKLMFNPGKQLFFNLPSTGLVTLGQLQVGRPRTLLPLPGPDGGMGLKAAGTRSAATVHVIDQRLNIHYKVVLGFEGERAVLRRVESSLSRFHFTVLLGGPLQLDLRAKLVGKHADWQDEGAQAVARAVVAACGGTPQGYAAFVAARGRGLLPPDLRLDTARRKTKTAYEGSLAVGGGRGPVPLRLEVEEVEDEAGVHTEVTGSLPEVDAELAQLLLQATAGGGGGRGGGGGGGGSALCGPEWAAGALQAAAAFADAANAALALAGSEA